MKNIICGIDDQYCQHCGAMLLSLFESNPGAITIYVLSLELSEKSKNLLKELVDSYQKQIHFIDRLEKSAKRTLEKLKIDLSQESNQD